MNLTPWQEHVLNTPTARRNQAKARNETYRERMLADGRVPLTIGCAYKPDPVIHYTEGGSIRYKECLTPTARGLPTVYCSPSLESKPRPFSVKVGLVCVALAAIYVTVIFLG